MSPELELETQTPTREERRQDRRARNMARYIIRKVNKGVTTEIPAKTRRLPAGWGGLGAVVNDATLGKINDRLADKDIKASAHLVRNGIGMEWHEFDVTKLPAVREEDTQFGGALPIPETEAHDQTAITALDQTHLHETP